MSDEICYIGFSMNAYESALLANFLARKYKLAERRRRDESN